MTAHQFFVKMDVHWIRLVVCLLPGLVLTKLATTFGNPPVFSKIALAVLMIGAAVYMFWKRIRVHIFGPEDADEEEQIEHASVEDSTAGPEHAEMVDELVRLCDGNANTALGLIRTELMLHTGFTYGDAIEAALARRQYESN